MEIVDINIVDTVVLGPTIVADISSTSFDTNLFEFEELDCDNFDCISDNVRHLYMGRSENGTYICFSDLDPNGDIEWNLIESLSESINIKLEEENVHRMIAKPVLQIPSIFGAPNDYISIFIQFANEMFMPASIPISMAEKMLKMFDVSDQWRIIVVERDDGEYREGVLSPKIDHHGFIDGKTGLVQ